VLVTGILHVAVKTKDLGGTIGFYEQVLGLRQAPRPDFGVPGAWMACSTPGGDPIIHLYAGETARDAEGKVPTGTAAIDHVSLAAYGYCASLERLARKGLDWRAYDVPGTSLRQIFTYDPSGVQLELTYDRDAEPDPWPEIPEARRSQAGTNFFDPSLYLAFNTSQSAR
jgi:catechol 2,3-dioxygenase-like lactoylglutathione lyase family enzyme